MVLADVIDMARLNLRDNKADAGGYRFSTETLVRYANDGIKDMINQHPELLVSSTGGLSAWTEIPQVDTFTFTPYVSHSSSGGYVAYSNIAAYKNLLGWPYSTWETLHFKAIAADDVEFYGTADDRTYGANALGSFDASATGLADIATGTVNGETSGFGGKLYVSTVPAAGDTWSVLVTGPTVMILGEMYNEILSNYITAACLGMEGDDTFNQARAKSYGEEYMSILNGRR